MPAITITALDDPVAIVHIPLHLSNSTASKLYWTVNDASQLSGEFFNVTSNRIEIAVFARTQLIQTHWKDVGDGEIQISATWRVFEITSGDEGETSNYDSPHLRHVSAPLSRAGISILYQSSYFTDFLLVKDSDFPKASQIFAEHGWHIHPGFPPHRPRPQLISPITPVTYSFKRTTPPTPTTSTSPSYDHSSIPQLTVLSSPLACIGFSRTDGRTISERVRQLVCWPEQARSSWRQKRLYHLHTHYAQTDRLLSPAANGADKDDGRPFLSYTRTEDGVSLMTETRILRCMFGKYSRDGEEENEEGEHDGDGEYQLAGRLAMGYMTDTSEFEDSGSEASDEEQKEEGATHPMAASEEMARNFHQASKEQREGRGYNPTSPEHNSRSSVELPSLSSSTQSRGRSSRPMSLPATPRSGVGGEIPISWCKTSSAKRMTIPSTSPTLRSDTSDIGLGRDGESLDQEGVPRGKKHGRKRCLQLDMSGIGEEGQDRVYHLDKSGLVTRFSDLLDSSSIRMLYSSTFHTANILVEAGDVMRAKRLLDRRGRSIKREDYFEL